MRRVFQALTILLLFCGSAPAQSPQAADPSPVQKPSDDTRLDNLHKPEQEEPPSAPSESWWQRVLREAPNCKSFTDGCRTCSQSHVCSNIGIACQPKEWACSDPASNAKPDAKPETKPDAQQ